MEWYDRVLANMNVDAIKSYVDKSMHLDQPEMTGTETAADIALGFTPYVGTAMGFRDFERARRDDDKLGMGLGILSMIPVAGGAVRAAGKGLKAVDEAGGMLDMVADAAKNKTDYRGVHTAPMKEVDKKGFDDYLDKVNPKSTEVPAEARPNLMMGDMYGMLPKGSKAIKSQDGVTFYKGADDNYYATAYNPDVGEQDVIGYISGRGDMTELAVVEEMQGKGIGSELQYHFRKDNPYSPTGGLTESGKKLLEKTFKRLEAEGVLPK